MQVGVEALEARVEVWHQRHEQDLRVDGLEPKGLREPAQAQLVSRRGCLVGGRLDPCEQLAARMLAYVRRPCEQPVDVLVRDVEAAERIVRVFVGFASPTTKRTRSSTTAQRPRRWVSEAVWSSSRRAPGDALPGVVGAVRQACAFVRGPHRSAAPSGTSSAMPIPSSSSTGGPAARTLAGVEGRGDERSSDGFSSPPSADQTSASARSFGGGSATVTVRP